MRPRLTGLALAAIAVVAWATGPVAAQASTLTLFAGRGFQGEQITYAGGGTSTVRSGFKADSAISTGLWTICDGREPTSRCQTINGAAPQLKLEPTIARPGVDAVALYERPGLKGRRVVYSFASNRPPPFRARSARTWGGPWSLCAAATGRCRTVDGRNASLNLDVAAVRPGRAPERVQIAAAAPTSAIPPAPRRTTSPSARAETHVTALARNDRAAAAPRTGAWRLPEALPRAAEPLAANRPSPRVEMAQQGAPTRPQAAQRVSYACEDGRRLVVLFDPRGDTAEVLSQDEDPLVLRRTSARQGFRYETWDHALYGDRQRATYEAGADGPVDCWARQPSRRAFGEP